MRRQPLSCDKRRQPHPAAAVTVETLAVECERPDLQFVLVAARRVKELTRDGEALSRDMVVRCVNALEVSFETCFAVLRAAAAHVCIVLL